MVVGVGAAAAALVSGGVLLGGPDATAYKPLRPFTVDHWRRYTRLMVLDNGQYWVTEDWQDLFAEDVFRGFDDAWLIVPEGNGKTTLLGGFALYHGDHTEDAAVPMAAASRNQCGLLFGQAGGFVRRSPGMRKRFRVYKGYRRVDCLRTGGMIEVFPADERTGDGILFTLAIIDELHRHKDLALYRTWSGKEGKRDGQLVVISTAGEPRTDFEDVRAAMVRSGHDVRKVGRFTRSAGDDSVIHEYALTIKDDPNNLELVKSANPFSGITVETLGKARAKPSFSLPHWLRMKCNVATRIDFAAVGEAEWDGRGVDGVDIPVGVPVDVGCDLGWKQDTTAIVPLWDRRNVEVVRDAAAAAELWRVVGAAQAAQAADWAVAAELSARGELQGLERTEGDARFLFGKASILEPPRDGNSLDPSLVEDAFRAIHARNPIGRVVLDPRAGGEQLAKWLTKQPEWMSDDDGDVVLWVRDGGWRPARRGEVGEPRSLLDQEGRPLGGLGVIVVIREQSPALQGDASERFMEGLRLRMFQHSKDPRLTRQVLNAVLREMPGGLRRFDRPAEARKSKTEDRREIDGIVAASSVYAEVTAGDPKVSIYEEKDLLILD